MHTDDERRSALKAIFIPEPAISIRAAQREFGVPTRTIDRDIVSIRKQLDLESNKKMKMFSMQNSSIVKQVIDNVEFEKAGPKQYLSQAEVDVLAFMGDELDQPDVEKIGAKWEAWLKR